MKYLLYISIFLFICFECETQSLTTCTNCNCFQKSPCVDKPGAYSACLSNTTQINCLDFGTLYQCAYGCGINADGGERCLCPKNCSGNGYCSLGSSCICNAGYFGLYCAQTDFCLGKVDGLHCNPDNTTQMIACYQQRVNSYHTCYNCTYDENTTRGYCNCPNDCSGNGQCSQSTLTLGQCQCDGNFVDPACGTEYTTCPPSIAKRRCSGNTLVSCVDGAVDSFAYCDYQCVEPFNGGDSYCTCENACSGKGSCSIAGVCSCFQGYVGKVCNETTVCTGLAGASYVCLNAATVGYCSDYILSSYTIDCPNGCSLGGCICDTTKCVNGYCLSSGECSCTSGWTGPRCDQPIGTTPVAVTAGFCASKVEGTYCDGEKLVSCLGGTLSSSTVCQYGCNSTLWAGSHTCRTINCPPGYFGSACEQSDPCVNGTMSNFLTSQDFCVGNYAVSCSTFNTSSRIFCVNGCAASTVNGRSIATCNCDCGPQGKDCDVNGNCVCQTGWLSCANGFTGDKCNVATNVCAGKMSATICQASNSSLLYCFNGVVSASQKCEGGCADDRGCACESNCSGNGFCGPNGSCFCRTGYAGSDCSQALECADQPNGFVCDSLGQNLLTCMRNRMLFNVTCSGGCVDGDCKCQYDCSGRGTCRDGVCLCNNGYVGDTCEIYLDSDIASVFIILIASGLAAGLAYALIIYLKTRVTTPEIELEDLRVKNRPNNGRLKISQRANTALKLNYNGVN